jgi:hypothetical protein
LLYWALPLPPYFPHVLPHALLAMLPGGNIFCVT